MSEVKNKVKISEQRVREIINEELALAIKEGRVDHEAVNNVVTAASKLLKAAGDFKGKMNSSLEGACSPHLDSLISKLEHVLENPVAYVDRIKPVRRTIRLRQVENDKK